MDWYRSASRTRMFSPQRPAATFNPTFDPMDSLNVLPSVVPGAQEPLPIMDESITKMFGFDDPAYQTPSTASLSTGSTRSVTPAPFLLTSPRLASKPKLALRAYDDASTAPKRASGSVPGLSLHEENRLAINQHATYGFIPKLVRQTSFDGSVMPMAHANLSNDPSQTAKLLQVMAATAAWKTAVADPTGTPYPAVPSTAPTTSTSSGASSPRFAPPYTFTPSPFAKPAYSPTPTPANSSPISNEPHYPYAAYLASLHHSRNSSGPGSINPALVLHQQVSPEATPTTSASPSSSSTSYSSPESYPVPMIPVALPRASSSTSTLSKASTLKDTTPTYRPPPHTGKIITKPMPVVIGNSTPVASSSSSSVPVNGPLNSSVHKEGDAAILCTNCRTAVSRSLTRVWSMAPN